MAGEVFGEGLAIGPSGAVDELLLLPDGHGLFERVDDPAAGVEGSAAMSGGDRDEDAGFAHGEAAEAMEDGDIANGKLLDRLSAQEMHLLQGHLFVRFVVEVQGRAAAGVVANDAVEDAKGSVGTGLDGVLDGCSVDGITHEGDLRGCSGIRASADRGEDGDLVSILEGAGAGAVLLIDGNGRESQRRGIGEAFVAEAREQIGDRRASGQIAPVAASRNNRLESTKGKNADANRGGAHCSRILRVASFVGAGFCCVGLAAIYSAGKPSYRFQHTGGSMLKGFRDFILRGNVVDLAVAVIIGAAFGAITSSLTADVITPTISAILGAPDFSALVIHVPVLHHVPPPPSPLPANYVPPGEIHIGKFLNAVIAFILNAAAIYFGIVLPFQFLLKRFNRPVVAPPTTKACPQCLGDIPMAATRCKFCTQVV